MDNLIFAISNESKEGTDNQITISTISRKGVRYSTTINDYLKCQKPKPMLTQDACAEFILENKSNITYIYDAKNDVIIVTIIVFEKKLSLEVILNKSSGEASLEDICAALSARIDELEPYEIIHTFGYPGWNSLEEFRGLPDFKYFEASADPRRFLKKVGEELLLIDDEFSYLIGEHNSNAKYDTPASHISLLFENWTCANMDKLYRIVIDPVQGPFINFNVSQPTHVVGGISYYLFYYIQWYTIGWILINFKWMAARNPIVDVIIKKSKVTINILRTKKQTYNTVINAIVRMPKIKIRKVIIDDRVFLSPS